MTQPEAYEDSRDSASLTSRLRHVYWIGGASGSGKSTIARRLADKHGLRLYWREGKPNAECPKYPVGAAGVAIGARQN